MQEVESAYMRRKAAVKGDSYHVTGGDGKSLEAPPPRDSNRREAVYKAVEPEYMCLVEIGGD